MRICRTRSNLNQTPGVTKYWYTNRTIKLSIFQDLKDANDVAALISADCLLKSKSLTAKVWSPLVKTSSRAANVGLNECGGFW